MTKSIGLAFFLALSLALAHAASAKEVDNFFKRERIKTLPDASERVNHHINLAIQNSIKAYTALKVACDPKNPVNNEILKTLEYGLNMNWPQAYYDMEADRALPIAVTQEQQSIYAGGTGGYLRPFATLDPTINLKGHYVGLDKVDHFLGHGYVYYMAVRKSGKLESAFREGARREKSAWGSSGTGVESFGDLASNYSGYLMWSNLLEGPDPYLTCKNGKFVQTRKVDIRDYVDDSWDEAINCSNFKPTYLARTEKRIKDISRSEGCPLDLSTCEALVNKYPREVAVHILHPRCLKRNRTESLEAKNEASFIETMRDAGDGAQGLGGQLNNLVQ